MNGLMEKRLENCIVVEWLTVKGSKGTNVFVSSHKPPHMFVTSSGSAFGVANSKVSLQMSLAHHHIHNNYHQYD